MSSSILMNEVVISVDEVGANIVLGNEVRGKLFPIMKFAGICKLN